MIKRNLFVVYKTDKIFDKQWRKRMEAILDVIDIPAFAFFLHKGYATWFIDGQDLHGESFEKEEPSEIVLNSTQRLAIIQIFRDIVYAGIKTGYTLADFTRKNIMLEGDTPYLIDYDVIIKGELPEDYINIFNVMLDYLKVPYTFKGDLQELYEQLGGDVL